MTKIAPLTVTGRPLGRSRGGLSTKIHLAADDRCRPIARVITPGQRHDAVAFQPLMGAIRIHRRGRGRPCTRSGRVRADKAYSSRDIRAYLRRRRIRATVPERSDQQAHRTRCGRTRCGRSGGRPPSSTLPTTPSATPSNAPSTNSNNSALWPPAMTNAPTSSPALSMSPRSASGSATPFHDLRDFA